MNPGYSSTGVNLRLAKGCLLEPPEARNCALYVSLLVNCRLDYIGTSWQYTSIQSIPSNDLLCPHHFNSFIQYFKFLVHDVSNLSYRGSSPVPDHLQRL
jgi:hypothetical protein